MAPGKGEGRWADGCVNTYFEDGRLARVSSTEQQDLLGVQWQ